MIRLEFVEHQEREVALPLELAAALSERFPQAVEVQPAATGRFRLKAQHFVGVLALRGLEIRISPKCPVTNLFFMLSYAFELARLRKESAGHARAEEIWDFLVALLINEVEELTRRGIARGYVEQTDELRALRGRLLVEQLIRRPPGRELTLPCRYEDLTSDLPHNQVIRFTLQTLTSPKARSLRTRLHRLRCLFAEVSLVSFRPRDLDHLEYTRLTLHYERIHAICRLLLDARGLDYQAGAYPLGCYLINMNTVFERFVAGWLKEHLPAPYHLIAQHREPFDVGHHFSIQPDLLLVGERQRRVLVADTKYKRTDGSSSSVTSSDAYQLTAYCRALGTSSGFLIYPDWNKPSLRTMIRDGQTTLFIDGIDVSQPTSEIERGLHRLRDRMLSAVR